MKRGGFRAAPLFAWGRFVGPWLVMDGKLGGGAEYAKARASFSHSTAESQVGRWNLRVETEEERKRRSGVGMHPGGETGCFGRSITGL